MLGTAAAAAGGTFIGLVFVLVGLFSTRCEGPVWGMQWLALPLGTLCGLLGSVLDSFLGATVQFSGNCVVRKKVCDFVPSLANSYEFLGFSNAEFILMVYLMRCRW